MDLVLPKGLEQTQWCKRVFFSGLGFWERTFLGWGFNFMYSEEKNTKIFSIKKFIHKLRRLKFVEEKNTMLIKLRKKHFKKIFLKDKKLSSH